MFRIIGPVALAALLLGSPAILHGDASGATGESVSGTVIANPIDVTLSISAAQVAAGTSAVATATIRNLGPAPLSGVRVSLRADPTLTIANATQTIASMAGFGSAQLTWPVCSGGPGNFLLVADVQSGMLTAESAAQLLQVGSGTATCPKSVTATVAAGHTLTTDLEGDGATAIGPIETAVTPSSAGLVSISETPTTPVPPSGIVSIPWQVQITAPAGSASNPIQIAFTLDTSILPAGIDPLTLQVSRDGLAVSPCPGDPCLASRVLIAGGDLALTVNTSAASRWTIGTIYPFNGFFAPINNLPTLNTLKAGQGAPVKFSLGGDRGLGIFAAGYPASQQIACDTSAPLDPVEQTVNAGSSSLNYDASGQQYTYIWKTNNSWANTCRELVLRLVDGTEHRARFKFR